MLHDRECFIQVAGVNWLIWRAYFGCYVIGFGCFILIFFT